MAAAVCTRKRIRSFWEEDLLDFPTLPTPLSKKLRCSSFTDPFAGVVVSDHHHHHHHHHQEDYDDEKRNLPKNNVEEWVELLVKDMMNSISIPDAKTRANRVFEDFEKSIHARSAGSEEEEATRRRRSHEEIEKLVHENSILKRAVAIQHQRQKEYDDEKKNQEVEELKELLGKYKEQVTNLKVDNYALTMHLQQACNNSINPYHYNRDVF